MDEVYVIAERHYHKNITRTLSQMNGDYHRNLRGFSRTKKPGNDATKVSDVLTQNPVQISPWVT